MRNRPVPTEGSKSIHCKTCEATKDSQVIPVTTHNFEKDPVAYTAPTATQNGSATYRCAVCQETKTIEIPGSGTDRWQNL